VAVQDAWSLEITIQVPDSRRPVVGCPNNETPVPAEFRVLDSVGVPSKHQRSGEVPVLVPDPRRIVPGGGDDVPSIRTERGMCHVKRVAY
jgi:hypothetical protein